MKILPAIFVWREVEVTDADGAVDKVMAMVPVPRYRRVADRQYHDGEEYPLQIVEVRSRASHSHYFASIHEFWLNLPENISERWTNEEHFRAWCLIETDWYNEKEVDAGTKKNANELATYLNAELPYARIWIIGSRVIIRVAKSQSLAAMGKDAFEASKKDVLELMGSMVGVSPAEMKKHAGRSA